ncbi:MAG: hypothetical protein Alis3KO_02450 [Aliiglaciecola sp.]
MRTIFYLGIWLLLTGHATAASQPIIDMHRHAPLSGSTDSESIDAMIDVLKQHNVVVSVVAITSPEQALAWQDKSDRFVLGAMMPCPRNLGSPWYYCFPETQGVPNLQWLRGRVQSGAVSAFHEMMFNYDGSLPGDAKLVPFWALAVEFNLPVGVHSWSGPPPGKSIRKDPNCCPNYNGDIGNPKHLRVVLDRHPGLNIWLQHVGSDGDSMPELWTETLSLLEDYPNVYVDLSITNSILPIEDYEKALVRLLESGFGNRIMLGSDNVPLDIILKRLNSIKSISEKQRAAILYDNAANFLNLSEAERDGHYGR